jgi:hypothetical protein
VLTVVVVSHLNYPRITIFNRQIDLPLNIHNFGGRLCLVYVTIIHTTLGLGSMFFLKIKGLPFNRIFQHKRQS